MDVADLLESFEGHGHPDVLSPILNGSSEMSAANAEEAISISNGTGGKMDYGAIIVGGGQAGLAVGGRLEALGVSYIIMDSHAEVGDAWKKRYQSLRYAVSPLR